LPSAESILVLLREVLFQREAVLVDSDAHNRTLDADEALQALGADLVSAGYFTATVVVWDPDPASAEEKRRLVERVINGRDFTTISETVNAVDIAKGAWLGSLSGHAYAPGTKICASRRSARSIWCTCCRCRRCGPGPSAMPIWAARRC